MNNKNKQRLSVLILVITLLLNGCKKEERDRFELVVNENSKFVALDDTYIDNKYINKYYVMELYNKKLNEVELHIVRFDGQMVGHVGTYVDMFTNVEFSVGYFSSLFNCVEITDLTGYLISFNLLQDKYSYDDMKNIYEVIKENYVFSNDNSLIKSRKFDNRI